MIAILSPAKNMRSTPQCNVPVTMPKRRAEAEQLWTVLRQMPAYELEGTMQISPTLALKAAENFIDWRSEGGEPAIFAYDGLAYKYLDADSMTDADLQYAQGHLRHLSALYGALRPLDLIHPYRLEMARRPRGMNLYEFWGDKLRNDLYADTDVVVNLASNEYSKAVSKHLRKGDRFLTCEFLSRRNGKLRCLAANAKMARGAMARYIVCNRVDTCEGLTGFDSLGFDFSPQLSNDAVYTYVQQL